MTLLMPAILYFPPDDPSVFKNVFRIATPLISLASVISLKVVHPTALCCARRRFQRTSRPYAPSLFLRVCSMTGAKVGVERDFMPQDRKPTRRKKLDHTPNRRSSIFFSILRRFRSYGIPTVTPVFHDMFASFPHFRSVAAFLQRLSPTQLWTAVVKPTQMSIPDNHHSPEDPAAPIINRIRP